MSVPVDFCILFLQKSRQKIPLFLGVEPSKAKGTWIPANREPFGVVVKQHESHAEICFQEKSENESNRKFDEINRCQEEIEFKYGGKLRWERLPEKKRSKIMTHPIPLGYKDIKNWNSLIAQLTDDAAIFFEVMSEKIY